MTNETLLDALKAALPILMEHDFPGAHPYRKAVYEQVKRAVELEGDTTRKIENLKKQVEALEALRPVWAQGHTSDSVAAQANGQALAALWKMLGVDNQTDASVRLMTLIKGEKK